MYKEKIIVPIGVTYVGETFDGRRLWEEYNLENYDFPHILNKVLTGCGYTEYCLTNEQDLVLISPRKFLLENKLAQHLEDLNIHYAENRTDVVVNYEKNIKLEDRKESSTNASKIEAALALKRESIEVLKRKVVEHVMICRRMGKPVKILVTYDSFRHVREALGEQVKNYQVVVDEFQSIFIDARFKSDAELELLYQLRDLQKVCFVSATPMLDKYLELLDEFKGLPYYEFDWGTEDPRRITKPELEIKFTSRSLNFWISKVIQEYLAGKFETMTLKDSRSYYLQSYVSKEAVFFLNSVTGICKAITTNLLSLDQCNILCAKTDENNKQVRDAFNLVIKKKAEQVGMSKPEFLKGNVIGEIPTKGQPHKMFTFCTRTVYLGADFYSECARTFIFSDANIECLSVDISMDLEQILGRQRLKENPWKNTATMFIKTTRGANKVPWEEFKKRLDEKETKTISLLRSYDSVSTEDKHNLAEKYQKDARVSHYRDDYVAVNEHAGSDLVPVFNKLMQVSEIRAFEIQQTDYADRFTVFNAASERGLIGNVEKPVDELALEFKNLTDEVNRLKFIVGLEEENLTKEELLSFFSLINNKKYFNYYDILGFEGIKACKCQESYVKRKIDSIKGNSMIDRDVKKEIYRLFQVGKRYINKDIKQSLKLLYERLGYQKTAKANDLEEYFEIKAVKFQDLSGKWVHGFELLSKK